MAPRRSAIALHNFATGRAAPFNPVLIRTYGRLYLSGHRRGCAEERTDGAIRAEVRPACLIRSETGSSAAASPTNLPSCRAGALIAETGMEFSFLAACFAARPSAS